MHQQLKNFFKATCLYIVGLAFSVTPSFAQEQATFFPEELSLTKVGGGGDASEMRVNEIRADLVDWIERGGAEGLELPYGLTLEEYESRMLAVLRAQVVNLTFVAEDHPTNPELQVSVDGKPKTCRGFLAASTSIPQIICNIERFANTEEALQYRLIHHEYAGLAYVERNDGSASDYFISNQITDFLKETTVLKLAVLPQGNSSDQISVVSERGGSRLLVYKRAGRELVFSVEDRGISTEIKRLEYQVSGRQLELAGDKSVYSFEILRKSFEVTSTAYRWCWNHNEETPPAIIVPVFTTLPCIVLPAVPAALGFALTPVDAIIGIVDSVFDADVVAGRKFKKIVKGKNRKASKKVFDSLIKQISNL